MSCFGDTVGGRSRKMDLRLNLQISTAARGTVCSPFLGLDHPDRSSFGGNWVERSKLQAIF